MTRRRSRPILALGSLLSTLLSFACAASPQPTSEDSGHAQAQDEVLAPAAPQAATEGEASPESLLAGLDASMRFPEGCAFKLENATVHLQGAAYSGPKLLCTLSTATVSLAVLELERPFFGDGHLADLLAALGADQVMDSWSIPGRDQPAWAASTIDQASDRSGNIQLTKTGSKLLVAEAYTSLAPPPLDPEAGMRAAKESMQVLYAVDSLIAGKAADAFAFGPGEGSLDVPTILSALEAGLPHVSPPRENGFVNPSRAGARAEIEWTRTNELEFDDRIHLVLTACARAELCGEAQHEFQSVSLRFQHLRDDSPKNSLQAPAWSFKRKGASAGASAVSFARCGVHIGVTNRDKYDVDIYPVAAKVEALLTPVLCPDETSQ